MTLPVFDPTTDRVAVIASAVVLPLLRGEASVRLDREPVPACRVVYTHGPESRPVLRPAVLVGTVDELVEAYRQCLVAAVERAARPDRDAPADLRISRRQLAGLTGDTPNRRGQALADRPAATAGSCII